MKSILLHPELTPCWPLFADVFFRVGLGVSRGRMGLNYFDIPAEFTQTNDRTGGLGKICNRFGLFHCIWNNKNLWLVHIDKLVEERRNSSALAMVLRLSCINPPICSFTQETRYVDGTPTSKVTPVTIRYIRPPHHGHTSQYHGHEWMTHILLVPCQSAVPFLRLTPGSRSWMWSKGKVIQSAQYHINSLRFHFTSIKPTIPEIELFRNLTLKRPRSRSWVRSKVKVTYCTQYPTDALPFRFT